MIPLRHLVGVVYAVVATMALAAPSPAALHPPAALAGGIFEGSLRSARDSLAAGRLSEALEFVERALLRDPRSAEAWLLRADWAAKKEDKDEQVYALHQAYRLKTLQKAPAAESKAIAAQLLTLDPVAADYFKLRDKFLGEMLKLGQSYEKENRPHSAIRAYRQVLALEPDHPEATLAIERVSARPDPSLAETAKPKDLLADVSQAFIADHDGKHDTWKTRAKLERDNYVTQTDAGYEVMVRTGEAMEQMSQFYRRFFHYAEDKKKGGVPRIDVLIFKNRDEYLKLGSGPPVEWSGGQFTGGSVETYVGAGGFEEMTTTLFHEAAHQFVSLATSASGWLNEGLASFFEGTRILANGTVVMNMPANHRLFPLVTRMKAGWMKDYQDGIDPKNASAEPTTAPTWEIILENKYAWGPPWYAPTWGVVYFLYDYQDPTDGRFVYRAAFREFINASGGRVGEGAIANFEKVVLANPSKVTPGYEKKSKVPLPQTCAELNPVWKAWMDDLAKEQSGANASPKPYLEWAECALIRKEPEVATEHFEKGILFSPDDVELLMAFSKHLLDNEKNPDRATKLLLHALALVEHVAKPDEKKIDDVEDLLVRCDPKRGQFKRLMKDLAAGSTQVVQRYIDEGFPLQAMEIASRIGTEMQLPTLFELFEKAARMTDRSIARWQLVYNEEDMKGWASPSKDVWMPYGSELLGHNGTYDPKNFDFNFMTCDKVTSGDFSFEAEVYAEPDKNVFCGLIFGRKSAETYHQLVLFPGHRADAAKKLDARADQVILSTMFGSNASKDWEKYRYPPSDRTGWHRLRVDVVDRFVDMYVDGDYIVTREFESADALRGSFGLVAGRGDCRFRNVKYQPRERNDLGAKIERTIRLEKIDKAQGAGSRNGRWKGKVPPPPKPDTWFAGDFKRFDDLGSAPKLVVFWNIAQNENIRIDGYLNDLFGRTRSSGLEIISIAHWLDRDKLPEYLKAHPFPGRVAVDHRDRAINGFGDTFDLYSVGDPNKGKNGMPWFVLLDLDDVVYWEGDPGFAVGQVWKPGDPCIIDDQVEALIETRKLKDFMAWREKWRLTIKPALGSGDFETALPELKKALDLSARAAEVAEAQRFWHAIEVTADDVPSFAAKLTEAGAEPALRVFYDWAARIEHPVPRDAQAKVAPLLSSAAAKEWDAVLKKVDAAKVKLGKSDSRSVLEGLTKELETLNGVFTMELKTSLGEAIASSDVDAGKRALDAAKRIPARWLVHRLATP